MKLKRKTYEARSEKRRDFWIGFWGWIGINTALWLGGLAAAPLVISLLGPGGWSTLANIGGWLVLLINVCGLIFLGLTRKWTAFGALAAIGTLLLITLAFGLWLWVTCAQEWG